MNYIDFTDNYEILEVIGHGSTCTVRRVIRKDTKQLFAAKMYQNEILKAKNQIDMLIRLDHPSIVNIYEYYEDEGLIILILEYMFGGELYTNLGQRQRLTESFVIQCMKKLVDAVRYCHELGVVHRDIKPENLLLSTPGPDGILKLADFGISKIVSDEMLITNCGTPIYMAPEIWHHEAYTQKVDIWSLGVVMYYLLSGEHPFEADEGTQLGKVIMSKPLTFNEAIWRSVSNRSTILLQQLLDKDPTKRPSAADISNHIWVSSVQIPRNFEERELNLEGTVQKMKRGIFKSRLRRSKNMMEAVQKCRKLPRRHFDFLILKGKDYVDMETEADGEDTNSQMGQVIGND